MLRVYRIHPISTIYCLAFTVLVTTQSVDALPSRTLLSLKFKLRLESKAYDQKGSLDQSLSIERMGVDTYQNSMTQVRIFKEDQEEISHVNLLFYL